MVQRLLQSRPKTAVTVTTALGQLSRRTDSDSGSLRPDCSGSDTARCRDPAQSCSPEARRRGSAHCQATQSTRPDGDLSLSFDPSPISNNIWLCFITLTKKARQANQSFFSWRTTPNRRNHARNRVEYNALIAGSSVLHSHDFRWVLIAWGVCAVAGALKFARLARRLRPALQIRQPEPVASTQGAREQLERIWRQTGD